MAKKAKTAKIETPRQRFKRLAKVRTNEVLDKLRILGHCARREDYEYTENEVKKIFNPEFLNRLDEIIVFDSLTEDDLREIVELLLRQVNQNLESKKIQIQLQEDAKSWIIDITCRDRSYGARPLRRAIQKYIEDPVSELIIQGKLKDNEILTVYWKEDALYYRNDGSEVEGALCSYDLV